MHEHDESVFLAANSKVRRDEDESTHKYTTDTEEGNPESDNAAPILPPLRQVLAEFWPDDSQSLAAPSSQISRCAPMSYLPPYNRDRYTFWDRSLRNSGKAVEATHPLRTARHHTHTATLRRNSLRVRTTPITLHTQLYEELQNLDRQLSRMHGRLAHILSRYGIWGPQLERIEDAINFSNCPHNIVAPSRSG